MRLTPTSILATLFASAALRGFAADPAIEYNRDVRTLFSNHCYQCHGPDHAQRVSDLRLDQLESVLARREAGVPIVPGNASQSEIVRRISSSDPDVKMPPPDSGQRLSAQQVQTIVRWIDEGAVWGRHWSFEQPTRPRLPEVQDCSWPANAIDHFVLSRLEREAMAPAPRADRRTLIRRVSLALTGLPPTPAEITAFEHDRGADGYDRLVDRLLQSPRYGEHMARYWLDVARYGDTHGLHLDNERSIWRYRDWVIEAHNRNLPFDQFTIEQLAGDLLPDATVEQRVATGFHRCNVTTSEGGAIAEEFLARYAVDRVETTSAAWLGLTVGCAACHDHKFDPISQTEFYQLFAYFNNLTERAMDGNALLPPPAIKAPTYPQRRRRQQLQRELADIESHLASQRQIAASQRGQWEPELAARMHRPAPPADAQLICAFDGSPMNAASPGSGSLAGNPDWIAGQLDQALRLDGTTFVEYPQVGDWEISDACSFGGWINIAANEHMTVLSKMNESLTFRGYELYLEQAKVHVQLVHEGDVDAIRVNTQLPISKEKWHHVFVTYDGSAKARGVKIYVNGVAAELDVTHDCLANSMRTDRPVRIGGRDQTVNFRGAIDELRMYARELDEAEVLSLTNRHPLAEILAIDDAARTDQQRTQLIDAHLREQNVEAGLLLARLQDARQRIRSLESEFPSSLVMQDRDDRRETFVLVRGQYDQPGDQVVAGVPQALPAYEARADPSRLALARWLVNPRHPLTARVTVNRMWQQHFGVGIVKSSEDFGSQGDWPSHPGLLDYLATELIRTGWDIKRLHRLIVTSSTFQQASVVTARQAASDPENRLLSRGPRFRLDAEVIRDLALAASGLLVADIGGPSVKPYQPPGLWEAVGYPSSTTARFKRDSGAGLYRRSMYTFWKRTSPPPAMQILDAPSREVCTVRRSRTNTPAAALLLMNDVQFVEAARMLSTRMCVEGGESDADRLDFGYQCVLGRSPTLSEQSALRDLLRDMRAAYGANPQLANELLHSGDYPILGDLDPCEGAAWTMIATTILNLDEAVCQH